MGPIPSSPLLVDHANILNGALGMYHLDVAHVSHLTVHRLHLGIHA